MFRYRPLSLWLAAFTAGILCVCFGGYTVGLALSFVIGVLCVLCVAVRRFPHKKAFIPVFLCFILGSAAFTVQDFVIKSKTRNANEREISLVGEVNETDMYGFSFTVTHSDYIEKGTKAYTYYDYSVPVNTGDSVQGRFVLSPGDGSDFADGIYFNASGKVLSVTSGRVLTPITAFKRYVCQTVEKHYSAETYGIVKAVLTGDSSAVDRVMYGAYRSAGIAHILVISGFHLSLIVMNAYALLSQTRLGRRYAALICFGFSFVFAFFVGFSPSVIRALVMCAGVFAGDMFNYRNDSFTSLFIALGVVLLFNPYAVLSVGLWLSFLCTLGIVTVSPVLYGKIGRLKKKSIRVIARTFAPMALTAAATVFSFPAAWATFSELSLVSPFANLIAIPLSSAATVLGYFSTVIPIICPLNDILFRLLNLTAVTLDGFSLATVSIYAPFMTAALAVSAVTVYLVCSVKQKRRLKAFCIGVCVFGMCICLSVLSSYAVTRNKIIVDSVNEKGCIQTLFVTESGCAFVDMGGYYTRPNSVSQNLKTEIDVYIMCKCDQNGMANLTRALSNTGIKSLYVNADGGDYSYISALKSYSEKWGIKLTLFDGNISVAVGDLRVNAGDEFVYSHNNEIYVYGNQTEKYMIDGKE